MNISKYSVANGDKLILVGYGLNDYAGPKTGSVYSRSGI
jgi:hypothetical protein